MNDNHKTKEGLIWDDHFENVAGYADLYVMNIEDDK